MKRPLAWWLFWLSLGVIVYTYIGFPLLVIVRGVLRPRPIRRSDDFAPTVSIIIPAYNEAAVIARKLDNILALDYPYDRLEVIVASDGSDDGTVERVRPYVPKGVRLLDLPRQGKNRALNAAVPEATGDILVFTDADTRLEPDGLRRLVAPFNDPEVGGVGGDFRYATDATYRGFWAADRLMNFFLSRAGSITAVPGQLYAIRRRLFKPVPDYVSDDPFIAKQVPAAHLRLVYAPDAAVYPLADYSAGSWFRRETRVASRVLQTILAHRRLLNPLEYGFYAIQLLSHKVLRRLIGLPLVIALTTALALWQQGTIYRLAAFSQLVGHAMGMVGFLFQDRWLAQQRPFSTLGHFEMMTTAGLIGLANVLRGHKCGVWTPQREGDPTGTNTHG
jgi:cellulose synthase/poly-beta-1,6-N-acetylglucosamine synthase-like glycosyltransferase